MTQHNLLRQHVADAAHVNHTGAGLRLVTGGAVPHDRAGKTNLTGSLQHRIVIAAVGRAEVRLRRDTEHAHNLVFVTLQLFLHTLSVQGGQVSVAVGMVRNLNLAALNQRTQQRHMLLKTGVRSVNEEGQASIRTLRELSIAANCLRACAVINSPRNILAVTNEGVADAGPFARLINRVASGGNGRRIRGCGASSSSRGLAASLIRSEITAGAVVVIRLLRAGSNQRKHSSAEHKKSAVRL